MKTCSIEGCEEELLARGWCGRHYHRRYRQENLERVREYDRRYREKNLENRLEYGRRYRKEHPEKVRESSRRWYENNRDKKLEFTRRYQENQIALGLCSKGCGRPLATSTRCNECLDKEITPEKLLSARRRAALRRKVARHQTEPGE